MSACESDQSLLVPFPTVCLSCHFHCRRRRSFERKWTHEWSASTGVRSIIHTHVRLRLVNSTDTRVRQLNCHDRLPSQFTCMSKKHILLRMSSCLVKMLLLRHRLIALANENWMQKSREKNNNNQCASMSKHISLIHRTLAAWWDRCAIGENTHSAQRLMIIFLLKVFPPTAYYQLSDCRRATNMPGTVGYRRHSPERRQKQCRSLLMWVRQVSVSC